MKCSILYKARMGLCVLAVGLSTTLSASQEEIAQEEIIQEEINQDQDVITPEQEDVDVDLEEEISVEVKKCKDCVVGIVPEWLLKEGIVPNLVLHSEELWRSNALFLKDALEAISFLAKGNEIEVIADRLLDNSKQINHFLKVHSGYRSDRVEVLLNEQNFTFFAYVLALKFDPADVPELEKLLDTLNQDLIEAVAKALKANDKFHKWLRKAFNQRLNALKEMSKGFVHASESHDFLNAYEALNLSLLTGQEVGAVIGWKAFYRNH